MKSRSQSELDSNQKPALPTNKIVLIIPIILCVYLFVTSITDVIPSLGVFDGKRLLQIVIIPLLFLIALLYHPLRSALNDLLRQTSKPVGIVLLIFFLLGTWSSLRFTHPAYSLIEVGMLLNLILLVFIVASARVVAPHHFDRLVLLFIAALGAAVMLQESMGILASWSVGSKFSYDNMFIYFSHPRFFNQLQTWTLPLLAALPFLFPENKKNRVIALVLLAMQWYLIFASGARGSVVSLIIAITLVGILAFPNGKTWLKLHFGGAVLGVSAYFAILLTQKILATGSGLILARSLERGITHTTGRTWIWSYAWKDAVQHPWLGAGPARFACNADGILPAHPHNMILQFFGEWGFPATLLILGLVIFLGWKLLKQVYSISRISESNTCVLQISLSAALIAGAIHTSVSGLLVMPSSQLMAALISGWLLGAISFQPIKPIRTVLLNTILITGLASSAAIALFGASELQQLNHRLQGFSNTERQMPRFWHEGRVCRYVY